VTDVAKAYKDFGFFTSRIFNNKTHLFRLSGFTTYPRTASYLDKVPALTANTDGRVNKLVTPVPTSRKARSSGVFAPLKRDFVATLLNFCSCPQDKFVMVLAPVHPTSLRYVGQSAHLLAIKILHRDSFLTPRQLCTP